MPTGELRAKFNARLGDIKKGALTRLFVAIVNDTPVLSGQLRANWTLIRGGQGNVVLRTIPNGHGAATGTPYGDPSFTIERDVELLVDEKDGTYFLINPMPYAYRIEYEGWSQKAPHGMVRINLAKFGLILQEVAAQKRSKTGRFLANAVDIVTDVLEAGAEAAALEAEGLETLL